MLSSSPVVTLPVKSHEIDWQLANRAFRAVNPGVLIVELDPWTEKVGMIELPDKVSERLRPTTGTVLARGVWHEGWDRKPWEDASEVNPGDRVVINRAGGDWFRNAWFGAYDCEGQLRVYGDGTTEYTAVQHQHPLFHVLGVIGDEMRAVHDKVLIRRDPIVEEKGEILLTERTKPRNAKATVLSIGKDVLRLYPELKVGDRVFYRGQAIVNEIEDLAREMDTDCCFIRAENILAVLNEVVEPMVAA